MHVSIDQYHFCTTNRHVHQDQYVEKTDFIYLKTWCDRVTYCQRGLFFLLTLYLSKVIFWRTNSSIYCKYVEEIKNYCAGKINDWWLTDECISMYPIERERGVKIIVHNYLNVIPEAGGGAHLNTYLFSSSRSLIIDSSSCRWPVSTAIIICMGLRNCGRNTIYNGYLAMLQL